MDQPLFILHNKFVSNMKGIELLQGNNVYYIPIPKVACTSLKVKIAELNGFTDKTPSNIHSLLKSHDIAVAKSQSRPKCLSFVRNPYDRVLSAYLSKVSNDSNNNENGFTKGVHSQLMKMYPGMFYAGMSFKHFIFNICLIPDAEAEEHFRSQYTFLSGGVIDFIGRFENLNDDFERGCTKLGIEFDPKKMSLQKLNKTQHSHFTKYYNRDLEYLVYNRYKIDFQQFKYNRIEKLML